MLDMNDELMHFAGEPTWNKLDLPTTDDEAWDKLVRSAKTQKQRQSLERHAMAEGRNWDEKGYSHLEP